MLKTYKMLKDDLRFFKAPEMKIKRMTENHEILKLTRNLYETDLMTPGYLVAGAICSPSYLSFDFALSYYGLIPERVYTYTSASCGKRKKKIYQNPLGTFTYRDVPVSAFPYEIMLKSEEGSVFAVASPEKALCDKLYTMKPVRSKKEMEYLLFEDLRVDKDELKKLDFSVLSELCPLYKSTSLNTFRKVIGGWNAEHSK